MMCYFCCNPMVPSTVLGTQEALNKYLSNFREPAHRLLTLMFGTDPCLKYSEKWFCLLS